MARRPAPTRHQTGEARWRAIHERLQQESDDRRVHDLALARSLDFADEHKVRLLIVIENLQDVLGVQMSEDQGWTLRHTLVNEPRIMLLATATRRFGGIDDPRLANYGQFLEFQLRPLGSEECRVIWQRLTGERLEGNFVRSIEVLSGGNPGRLAELALGHASIDTPR